MPRNDVEWGLRVFVLAATLLSGVVAAGAQTMAPAMDQSGSPSIGPSAASPSAGPSGTVLGAPSPIGTGVSQNAPAPPGIGAPSVAPPAGVSVRLGNLNDVLAATNAAGGIGLTRPAGLSIVPSIALQEELTSNATASGGGGNSADLITTLTPGLLVNLATPRAAGTLSYFPSLQVYARNSASDNISQQLNGSFEATLLPQTLFLALNGFVTEQNTIGGVTPGGFVNTFPQNRTTSTGFLINPSFMHRFGETGTFRLGYSLSEASNSGDTLVLPSEAEPFFAPSHAVTNQGTASFTTGSAFGRLNDVVAASAAVSTGTGVLNGAHQYVFINTVRFALLRHLAIFGTGGYEDILYSSFPPVEISDAVWAGGFTLSPRPDTRITVGYGHFEGIDAPFANATIALSARTILTASYSDLLSTSLQSLQAALATTVVGPNGVPLSSETGAPVLLTNQLLSLQTGVFRDQLFSAAVISTWPRDVYALSMLDERQKLVADAFGQAGFSQSSLSAALSWSHALSPSLGSFAYLQGGTTTSAAVGSGTTPTVAAQFSLADTISPTLIGSASLLFTNQWSTGVASGTTFQAALIVALRKVF